MQKRFARGFSKLIGDFTHQGWASVCLRLGSNISRVLVVVVLGGLLTVPAAQALQLTVAWDNTSSGATGFKVERSTDGVSFAEIATVDVTSTTYIDSNLTSGSYAYRVRAFNATTTSDYSNVAVYSTDSIPVITSQPASQSVIVGSSVSFSVAATGSPAPTFQWLKNGVAIAGATSNTFSLGTTDFSDAATYTVVASNSAGSVTSNDAALIVSGIAPVITTQPASQSVAEGSTVSFSVAASGTPTPTFQWTKNGVPITGATGSTFTLAGVSSTDAAAYAVIATNNVAATLSQDAVLTVTTATTTVDTSTALTTTDSTGRLANVSARAIPGKSSAQSLSLSFTVAGSSKTILLRGIGPGLAAYTTVSTLDDPKISLSDGTVTVASNDNWGGSQTLVSLFTQVGAFPLPTDSKDAALVSTLVPQDYVGSFNGKTGGMAMMELYDADSVAGVGRFSKIVARAPVDTGEGLLMAGFTITGDTALRVLIRAIGPSLSGIKGALADPQLVIYSGADVIQGNDNWGGGTALASLFTQVGATSLAAHSKDAAIDLTLQPGTYSAVISGVNNTTGVAAIEFYEVR